MNTDPLNNGPNDDQFEDLHLENEFIKLKLQAEHGAMINSSDDIPPEMEHIFLKQVQEFEKAWQNVTMTKIYDLINCPAYKKEMELSDAELKIELRRLIQMMKEKSIMLEANKKCKPRILYRFITEEFFFHETENIQLPGFTHHFSYEEFQEDHELEIRERTGNFFSEWFLRMMDEYSWYLNRHFVLESGVTISLQTVADKLRKLFEAYREITDGQYSIEKIRFQNADEGRMLGHSEGFVSYKAQLESGEEIKIEGSFKLYFSRDSSFWNIYSFVMPGFQW
jgi:hypothetical protein